MLQVFPETSKMIFFLTQMINNPLNRVPYHWLSFPSTGHTLWKLVFHLTHCSLVEHEIVFLPWIRDDDSSSEFASASSQVGAVVKPRKVKPWGKIFEYNIQFQILILQEEEFLLNYWIISIIFVILKSSGFVKLELLGST